jgi:predicted dehydrogenase
MHIWSSRCFASVDFAERTLTLVRPSEELLRREFDAERLSVEQIDHVKEHLFDELLSLERIQAQPCDQLAAELADFVTCIRQGRSPRASGQQGRDAIAVAEQILSSIAKHAWDGTENGRIGPLVTHVPSVLRGPHWHQETGSSLPLHRREAG